MKAFTKSLSRKLITIFLAGLLLLSVFSFFNGKQILQDYISVHFSEMDRIVSLGSKELLLNWIEYESYEEINKDLYMISYFTEMVKEMEIQTIYLVHVQEDDPYGTVLLSVSNDGVVIHVSDSGKETYLLDPEEVEMAQGLRQDYETTLDSSLGKLHYYFTVVHLDDGHSILVGFYMQDEEYFGILSNLAFKMYGGIAIGVLVVILLLSLGIRYLIIQRIKRVSDRMKNYVENGKLSEEILPVQGNDEIAQMEESFNHMTQEIHDYIEENRAYEDERNRVLSEMSIAASIQEGLLPKPHFENEVIMADGYMKPARNVGGDFYSYHRLHDGKFVFGIGDVSGKGVSAAMFMSSVTSVLRYSFRFDEDPARILKVVNQFACEENKESMFVTVFVGIYDPVTQTITYSSAGHNPPYLVGRTVDRLDQAQGMVLGIFEEEEYSNATIQIEPGSTLVLYTDGVTEATNEKKEFFKESHLVEVLQAATQRVNETENAQPNADHSSQSEENADVRINPIYTAVLKSVGDFVGKADPADDITLFTLLFKEDSGTLVVPAKVGEMKKVRDFIFRQARIPSALKKKIILAVEELFVNTASYGYEKGKAGTVEIQLTYEDQTLTLVMKDDAKAYNPLDQILDVDDYDMDTQIGGLGKYIAFNIMDESSYEYRDGFNILTMKKTL